MDPFISAQDLSDYLSSDVSADPRTVIVLDAACETVRGYLQQTINYVPDDVVHLDGTRTQALILPELPVQEVAAVSEYDTDGENQDDLLVNDDYIVGYGGVLWRVGCRWRWGKQNIVVTYSHGWDVTGLLGSGSGGGISGVPSDIRFVALSLATRMFYGASSKAGAMKSETIGKYSYTINDATTGSTSSLLPAEQRVLDRWRMRGVA